MKNKLNKKNYIIFNLFKMNSIVPDSVENSVKIPGRTVIEKAKNSTLRVHILLFRYTVIIQTIKLKKGKIFLVKNHKSKNSCLEGG